MCIRDSLRDKTCPYDGVISVLKALAKMGVRTAIVSNKFDQAVKLLSREYFAGLVESEVGESETVRRKPSPDGVDVYKRQQLYQQTGVGLRIYGGFPVAERIHGEHPPQDREKHRQAALYHDGGGRGPVSYTHLKRIL